MSARLRSGLQRNNSPVTSKPRRLIRRDYQGVCPCGGNSAVRDLVLRFISSLTYSKPDNSCRRFGTEGGDCKAFREGYDDTWPP
jgi:hypothetical protein